MAEQAKVSELLGNSGELPVITWNGTDYKVCWPTPVTLTVISNEISRQAVEILTKLKDAGMPNYAELRSEALNEIYSGSHEVGGELWQAAMHQRVNMATLLLWGLIKENHPKFTRKEALQMFKNAKTRLHIDAVLGMVTPRFFSLTAELLPTTPEEDQKMLASLAEHEEALTK